MQTVVALIVPSALLVLLGFGSTRNDAVLPPQPPIRYYAPSPPYVPECQPFYEPPAPPPPQTKTMRVRVTACSPHDPLDQDYYRANGYEGRLTRAVAADYRVFPKGTLMRIPGYAGGAWVPVDSRGGSVIRKSTQRGIAHIDVKFATLYSARKWGSQYITVEIKEP